MLCYLYLKVKRIIIIFNCKRWQCPRWSWDLSLASTGFGLNTPKMPLPASNHPPNSSPSPPLEPPQSSSTSETSQHRFFDLNSLAPTNRELPHSSELLHRGGGCRQLPGQPACAGFPHLPLPGLLFPPWRCGSGEREPLLRRVSRRSWRRQASLKAAGWAW